MIKAGSLKLSDRPSFPSLASRIQFANNEIMSANQSIQRQMESDSRVPYSLDAIQTILDKQHEYFDQHGIGRYSVRAQLHETLRMSPCHGFVFVDFDGTILNLERYHQQNGVGWLARPYFECYNGTSLEGWKIAFDSLKTFGFKVILCTNRMPICGEDEIFFRMIDQDLKSFFQAKIFVSNIIPKGAVMQYLQNAFATRHPFRIHNRNLYLLDDNLLQLQSAVRCGFQGIQALSIPLPNGIVPQIMSFAGQMIPKLASVDCEFIQRLKTIRLFVPAVRLSSPSMVRAEGRVPFSPTSSTASGFENLEVSPRFVSSVGALMGESTAPSSSLGPVSTGIVPPAFDRPVAIDGVAIPSAKMTPRMERARLLQSSLSYMQEENLLARSSVLDQSSFQSDVSRTDDNAYQLNEVVIEALMRGGEIPREFIVPPSPRARPTQIFSPEMCAFDEADAEARKRGRS